MTRVARAPWKVRARRTHFQDPGTLVCVDVVEGADGHVVGSVTRDELRAQRDQLVLALGATRAALARWMGFAGAKPGQKDYEGWRWVLEQADAALASTSGEQPAEPSPEDAEIGGRR